MPGVMRPTPAAPEQAPADSTSLDLPPSLSALLDTSIPEVMQPPAVGIGGAGGMGMSYTQQAQPSYQEGGMVGPGGMPIRPPQGGAPGLASPTAGQTMTPQQVMTEAQRFVSQHPQQFQQIQQEVQAGLQRGEFTAEEMNMLVQLATAATQNPELYPQMRAALISQGVAEEDDLPPEYDAGLMFILIVIGQSMGAMAQQAPSLDQYMGQQDGGGALPGLPGGVSMRQGGALPERSPNPDGSIPIRAHEGEYVIPKEVVRRLGTKHFDDLIKKARESEGGEM